MNSKKNTRKEKITKKKNARKEKITKKKNTRNNARNNTKKHKNNYENMKNVNVKGGAPPRAPNAKIQKRMTKKYDRQRNKGKTNLKYTRRGLIRNKTYYETKSADGTITVAKRGRFKKSSSSKLAKNNRQIDKLERRMKSLQDSLQLTPGAPQNAGIRKRISDMQTKIKKLQANNTKITIKKAHKK